MTAFWWFLVFISGFLFVVGGAAPISEYDDRMYTRLQQITFWLSVGAYAIVQAVT
jgi:hypothetical protein